MLFTDLKPQRDVYNAAHSSTVIDFYTPLFPDKTPELTAIGSPAPAHCNLCIARRRAS